MKTLATVFVAHALSLMLPFAAMADIAIGTAGPLTGEFAKFGAQLKAGAEMAVNDINASGGILGKQLKLHIEDDICHPGEVADNHKKAKEVAQKMAEHGVVFIAGHFCGDSSIAASKIYEEEGIVQISPASTNPKLTDEGASNIFRVSGRDDQQAAIAASYIAKHFKDKRIAILHDHTPYGKGLADQTRKAMEKHGKKAVLHDAITAGKKDYKPLIAKLKQAAIDYVYLGGYHAEAGLIVRQMRDQGLKTRLIGGDALVTSEFWAVSGEAGEGTLMTFMPDPRHNPAAAALVKKFRDANIEPEGYVLYTYAAIQAWKQAAEKAGTVDPAKVTTILHSKMSFNTVLGSLSFNKTGDVNLPGYRFYQWSKGKYDHVE